MSIVYRSSGPVVWAGIFTTTCLLLVVFQQMLWLVVPFLLAMIIYYSLRPAVHRLTLGGMDADRAAIVVIAAFTALSALVLATLLPWMTSKAVSWQESAVHYLNGGLTLVDNTLKALEQKFAFLGRARISEQAMAQAADFTNNFAQRHLAETALGIAAWLPSMLLAPFLAFFFLRDGKRFKRFLGRAVPNAFFERTLFLLHEVDKTARSYIQGLLLLTLLDTLALGLGLWMIGISSPLALGLLAAVLSWIPYVGSIVGGILVLLVAATDFPDAPGIAYATVALFILARLLDDFVFMPATIGRSLHMHPLVTVLFIFVGGAVAGVAGLMLVLPLAGVVMVIGDTIGKIVTDPRLQARHAHAKRLRQEQAAHDL